MSETILRAARELLEDCGVDELSVRELARRAGVSHAAPYRHFGDRDGFRQALAAYCFEEFLAAQQAAEAEAPAGSRLLAVGRAYVSYGVAHPHAFELIYGSSIGHQSAELADLVRTHTELLTDCVRDAIEHGVVPVNADPRDVGTALWSLAHGLTYLAGRGFVDANRIDASLAALLQSRLTSPPVSRKDGDGA